jgi:hypothetical protein
MARGSESKNRRKESRKQARIEEAESAAAGGMHDFMVPVDEDDVDDDDDDDERQQPEHQQQETSASDLLNVPKSKKKKQNAATAAAAMNRHAAEASAAPKKREIKTLPLIFLILMTGTTVLPAVIYASDYFGAYFQKHHVLGSLGYKLGIGATPKKRVLSFYEKHDPSKIDDVPAILAKYYGDYPKLIKKLERKYGDYGYFLEWEADEAPMRLAMEQLEATREYLGDQWNIYAPRSLKQAARNVRYNVGTLYKKFRKVWKKYLWPLLEPIFGVPKGTAAQKRKDAAEARARKTKAGGSGTRRKNTDYRDDMEDEH